MSTDRLPISVGHMFDFRLPPFHNPQNCGQDYFYGNRTELSWTEASRGELNVDVSKVDRAITWLKCSVPTGAIAATAFPPCILFSIRPWLVQFSLGTTVIMDFGQAAFKICCNLYLPWWLGRRNRSLLLRSACGKIFPNKNWVSCGISVY